MVLSSFENLDLHNTWSVYLEYWKMNWIVFTYIFISIGMLLIHIFYSFANIFHHFFVRLTFAVQHDVLLNAVGMTWWRHQIWTFSVLLALCARNSLVTGEFSSQRPMTQSFDVFFVLHLNKRLCKQSRHWRFQTPSHSLWHHSNDIYLFHTCMIQNNALLMKILLYFFMVICSLNFEMF